MADPQQKEILDLLLNGEPSRPAPSAAATRQAPAKKSSTSAVVSQPHKASPKSSSRGGNTSQVVGRGKGPASTADVERGGEWEEYVRMLAEGAGPGQNTYAMPLGVPMYAPGPFMAYNPPMGMGMGMMGMGMGWGLAPVPLHPYGPPMAVPVQPRPFPEAVPVTSTPPAATPKAQSKMVAAPPTPVSPVSALAETESPAAPPPVPHVKPKSWATVATSPTATVAATPPSPSAPAEASTPIAAPEAVAASPATASSSSAPPLAPAQKAATAAAVRAIAESPAQLVGVNPAPGQFQARPPHSRQFVIKSFSEDDVHKSIKYGIWASTDNGNRRLDAAYRQAAAAQPPMPVYLFFSVNGSGQFCGMAQMTSPLDFTKKADVWAQDKWNGCFTVKWIFIKDIPNNALRHIHLPNNENKPVTNSRDTTEVLQEQGWEVLRVFADYRHKTCLLDDFAYYEQRTALLREKQQQQQQSKQQPQASAQDASAPAPEPTPAPAAAPATKGGGRKNNRK